MIYALILIILVVVVLVALKLFSGNDEPEFVAKPKEEPREIASDCCGAHEVCEFDEADFDENVIIYFNDEELDELRNVREDQLTASQIDELRDVLYTLRTEEIGKWLTSISRRHIHLPVILQQEARQLMVER